MIVASIIFTLICSTLVFSCGPVDQRVAKSTISRDTFQKILYELHYTDAATQVLSANKDSVWRLTWSNYKGIFEKHHVKYADFRMAFLYYCYHSKELDEMYQAMLDNISIQQAQLEKK